MTIGVTNFSSTNHESTLWTNHFAMNDTMHACASVTPLIYRLYIVVLTFKLVAKSRIMGSCLSIENFPRMGTNLQHSLTLSRYNRVATEFYDILGKIGSGSMGAVYVCSRKPRDDNGSISDGSFSNKSGKRERFAMKAINKALVESKMDVTLKEIREEIEYLKDLDHPYIVKCIETFENQHNIFIIMDFCKGGNLHSRQPYTESKAAEIFSQLQSALTYIHERNVIHRDIKFENIIFENTHENSPIKLIDFGLATKTRIGKSSALGTAGTISTMAPEVLKNEPYSTKADIWSLGICTFMLLTGKNPIKCDEEGFQESVLVKNTLNNIKTGHISFQDDDWIDISKAAMTLVKSLLSLVPEDRPSAREISSCDWLKEQNIYSSIMYDEGSLKKVKEGLKRYIKASSLKKLGWMIIAHRMQNTDDELSSIRRMFQKFDIENNGIISREEFGLALGSVYSRDEISEVFDILDVEKDGVIHYTEWLAAMMESNIFVKKDSLLHAFNVLDCDNSGTISKGNLQKLLGNGYDKDLIKKMIAEVDLGGHGVVSKREFIALFDENRLSKSTRNMTGDSMHKSTMT